MYTSIKQRCPCLSKNRSNSTWIWGIVFLSHIIPSEGSKERNSSTFGEAANSRAIDAKYAGTSAETVSAHPNIMPRSLEISAFNSKKIIFNYTSSQQISLTLCLIVIFFKSINLMNHIKLNESKRKRFIIVA